MAIPSIERWHRCRGERRGERWPRSRGIGWNRSKGCYDEDPDFRLPGEVGSGGGGGGGRCQRGGGISEKKSKDGTAAVKLDEGKEGKKIERSGESSASLVVVKRTHKGGGCGGLVKLYDGRSLTKWRLDAHRLHSETKKSYSHLFSMRRMIREAIRLKFNSNRLITFKERMEQPAGRPQLEWTTDEMTFIVNAFGRVYNPLEGIPFGRTTVTPPA